MNRPTYLCCLLALGLAGALSAQESAGIHLDGTLAAVTGPARSATVRATSQAGEAAPVGAAVSASYTLFSGSHIPDEVDRILQYTLSAGWHMLGAPGTTDRTTGEIFVGRSGSPIKVGPIQYFDSAALRYVQTADTARILPRQGFWLFSYWGGRSQTFTARPHIAVRNWLEEIPRGTWVLYSPPGKIILEDDASLTVFGWNAADQNYELRSAGDTIEPLRGYWVYRDAE